VQLPFAIQFPTQLTGGQGVLLMQLITFLQHKQCSCQAFGRCKLKQRSSIMWLALRPLHS
jgi:hypothetical protein